MPSDEKIIVSHAAVLQLGAAVAASRLGFDWKEPLTLGHAVAGLNAEPKGPAPGAFEPAQRSVKARRDNLKEGEHLTIELLGCAVPVACDSGATLRTWRNCGWLFLALANR